MNKPLALILATSIAAMSLPALAAEADIGTRYVWANNLRLRSAPDAKSEEMARLPLGTSVQLLPASGQLVHREDSVPGLRLDGQVDGKPLKMVGDWRRVRVGSAEGWVFDGYLSRYPYPKSTKGSDKVAMEFAAAKALFGGKVEQRWMSGDATDSEAYRNMPQRLKDESAPDNHAEISWDRVAFTSGGMGELAIDTREGGEGWTVTLTNLPMTYQETLLWAKRWGWMGDYGAVLDDGRAKLRFDFDETEADMEYTIACAEQTCSIQYSYATE